MITDPSDRANAEVFLDRLLHLDASALVRLRPTSGPDTGAGGAAPGEPGADAQLLTMWARLPWDVLVSRTLRGFIADDRTYQAADLMAALGRTDGVEPRRRDAQWRTPLPPHGLRPVERLPATVVRRVAAAAAKALREAEKSGIRGRAIGQRALRDALLDHPVVTGRSDVDGASFVVPQRLVQAVVRMGLLGSDDEFVTVGITGPWTALAASFGTAWFRSASALTMRPVAN